ncbi:MAG: hypothetical protein APR54_02985 [Candidatus Cloacimonas sp. SDB]|nr:MAG: hypothetical protein APR54_02985 [Candidatus Cloacimonas sp. SDB]
MVSQTNWTGNTHYWGLGASGPFGNGFIPLFAVIGGNNECFYNDNYFAQVAPALTLALESFGLTALFSSNVTQGPPELGVQFRDLSSPSNDIQSWEWDLDGDGIIDSVEEDPYHIYDTPGVYDVSLTVTTSEEVAELTIPEYITVTDPTAISGSVAGVWSPDYGPYIITEDILVNDLSHLEIETGTEIIFTEGTKITVNGQLTVNGEWDNPVNFSSESQWSGIHFANTQLENVLDGCKISNVLGSAITVEENSCLQVKNSWIIENNSSENKGTAFEIVNSDDVVIEKNIIANNSNSNLTGGISCLASNPIIKNNLIVNNGSPTALAGAASFKSGSQPTLINNTIANNLSSGCTIFTFNSQVDIMNSIIFSDSYIFTTIGNLPAVSYTCISGGYTGEGNIDEDPGFVGASAGAGPDYNGYEAEWYLSEGSPCIDMGNPAADYYDVEDPADPGNALWPAMGTVTNDMGAFGGTGLFEYVGSEEIILDIVKISTMKTYPNPFNPETKIALQLNSQDVDHPINLSIYNLKGQLVKTLISNSLVTSGKEIIWNGTDNSGSAISTGIYFVRLETATNVVSSKVVLLK